MAKLRKLKPFRILSEVEEYRDGVRFSVRRAQLVTPSGLEVNWAYIKMRDGVIVLPVDAGGNVLLKTEWRLGRKGFVTELPSGWIETKEKPSKSDILKRANIELQEEVGAKSNNLILLTSFYVMNHSSHKFHIVLARDLAPSRLPGDEHEYVKIESVPFSEAKDRVLYQQVPTAQLIIAFLLAEKRLPKLRSFNRRSSSMRLSK